MTEVIEEAERKLIEEKFNSIRHKEARILISKQGNKLKSDFYGTIWTETGTDRFLLEREMESLEGWEKNKIKDKNYRSAMDYWKDSKKIHDDDYDYKWRLLLASLKKLDIYIDDASRKFGITIPTLEEKINEIKKVEEAIEKAKEMTQGKYETSHQAIPQSTYDLDSLSKDLTDMSDFLSSAVLNTRDAKRYAVRLRDVVKLTDAETKFKHEVEFFVDKVLGTYKLNVLDGTMKDQLQNFYTSVKDWYDNRSKQAD